MVEAVHRPDHATFADLRNVRVIVRQEPHADVVLKKRVHAVKSASRPAAGDGNVAVADDYAQVLVAEALRVKADVAGVHPRALADEDVIVRAVSACDDGQLHAR